IWAFVRLTTNPRVWPNPLPPDDAFSIVRQWLAEPNVVTLHPGPRHLEILQRLVVADQSAGRRVTDAVLAALALESGAKLASTDHVFRRFTDLGWVNPLTP